MSNKVVPDRGDPVAAARRANSSAGECGDKDQVSRSGPPTRPLGGHLAIVGATATGKTALAVALARAFGDAELISVDAMAVYRGLDIGTAKPTAAERDGLVWHLVDIADPAEEFSVAEFQRAARAALDSIEARGRRAILVGGTGLYHRAVIDELDLPGRYGEVKDGLEREADALGLDVLYARLTELDPVAASRIEPTNQRRIIRALEVSVGSGIPFSASGPGLDAYPPSRFAQVGLGCPRALLDERIAARLDRQLGSGFLEEVRGLSRRTGGLARTARQALGYRELLAYLDGSTSLESAISETLRRTRAFARRQERWFRRDPRVEWRDVADPDLAASIISMATRDT